LLRNGSPYGPYPEEQIREWIKSGQIAPDEQLNREGDATWQPLSAIPEFAAERAAAPPAPSVMQAQAYSANPSKDRVVAGILAILLGTFGVHHFYLGNIGIIYIVLSCLGVSFILGIIDGIMYLTKTEDQFQRNYHNWFCSGP
jgi:TM2 domain-containing membrane protein YozV